MERDQVSMNEIMEFLQEHMVTKDEQKADIDGLRKDLRMEISQSADSLRSEIRQSELRMMDGMDEKLLRLKSDLVVLIRKEDNKLGELVQMLVDKKILGDADLRRILSMEPFPRAS